MTERFGGTVAHVAGDEVMGLFGVPVAMEDHALAACCAALAMHQAVVLAHPRMLLRFGIDTAEVLVNAAGPSRPFQVVGQTMNRAKRLQTAAAPGASWMSVATRELAAHRVVSRALGMMSLKGFPEPVEAFALEAADASQTRLDRQAGPASPFIDRGAEFASLEEAEARSRAGRGAAVAIVGEAGLGESRLLREFCAGRSSSVPVHGGARCIRWHEDSSFHALRPLMRRLLGLEAPGALPFPALRPVSDPEAIAALLELSQPGPDWMALAPAQRGRRMIAAAALVLLSAARDGPAIPVVDSLHWTGSETEAVLAAVLERIAEHPLLLLLGWRPERAPARASHQAMHVHTLATLGEEDAARRAAALLGTEADAAARIGARSGGNPLFVEEEVAVLRAAGEGAQPRVSGTVRGLIAAGLGRLAEGEKVALEALAVPGEPTAEPLVRAVLGADDESRTLAAARPRGSPARSDADPPPPRLSNHEPQPISHQPPRQNLPQRSPTGGRPPPAERDHPCAPPWPAAARCARGPWAAQDALQPRRPLDPHGRMRRHLRGAGGRESPAVTVDDRCHAPQGASHRRQTAQEGALPAATGGPRAG